MERDPEILTDITEISPILAGLQGRNVFSVPDGYFSELSTRINEELTTQNIIDTSGKSAPQAVPHDYFTTLSTTIIDRIKTQETTETDEANILDTISRRNVLSVPEGYFETFASRLLEKLNNNSRARVISFQKNSSVFRYAAAAVIGLAILGTSYFLINNNAKKNNSFAVVTKKTVPDPAAAQYNSLKKFNEGIASLSDDEIIAYLETHGNILDNDQIINDADDTALPDALDYLTDDRALDKYLKKINAELN